MENEVGYDGREAFDWIKNNLKVVDGGDLEIGKITQQFTLNLNGQAVFVDGSIVVGDKLTLKGSGVIIATGDITFMPIVTSKPGDYILVMSVEGKVILQPKGEFYGTVAGDSLVRLQPNFSTSHLPPPGTLNFPIIPDGNRWEVKTWEISRE